MSGHPKLCPGDAFCLCWFMWVLYPLPPQHPHIHTCAMTLHVAKGQAIGGVCVCCPTLASFITVIASLFHYFSRVLDVLPPTNLGRHLSRLVSIVWLIALLSFPLRLLFSSLSPWGSTWSPPGECAAPVSCSFPSLKQEEQQQYHHSHLRLEISWTMAMRVTRIIAIFFF